MSNTTKTRKQTIKKAAPAAALVVLGTTAIVVTRLNVKYFRMQHELLCAKHDTFVALTMINRMYNENPEFVQATADAMDNELVELVKTLSPKQ
jgi:hypothetical protein